MHKEITMTTDRIGAIADYLGDSADDLLNHRCQTIPRESLTLPGADFSERVWLGSDRNPQVIRSLQQIYDSGRLGGTRLCVDICRSTRASSTRLARPLRQIPPTLTPRASSNWRWKAAATRWHPPLACWA